MKDARKDIREQVVLSKKVARPGQFRCGYFRLYQRHDSGIWPPRIVKIFGIPAGYICIAGYNSWDIHCIPGITSPGQNCFLVGVKVE
jgi:hypothetical protein